MKYRLLIALSILLNAIFISVPAFGDNLEKIGSRKLIVMTENTLSLLCFSLVNCTNPLGKGTWTPLPFKKKQTIITPADTTEIKSDSK